MNSQEKFFLSTVEPFLQQLLFGDLETNIS